MEGIKADTESQQPGGDLADSDDDPCVVRLLRGTGESADQRRERLSDALRVQMKVDT